MRVWILGLYAAVLVGIVVLANLGGTNEVFGLLTDLPFGDKLGHLVLIGGLAGLADVAANRRNWGRVPLAPLIVAVVALLEELTQLWLPTRSFDLGDLAADVVGIVLFTLLSRALARRRRPRHSGDAAV